MNISCDVINDLLPLYVEGLVSEDSRIIIEKHLNECVNCNKEFQSFKKLKTIPMDTSMEPFKRVKRKLSKKRSQLILSTIIIVLIVVIVCINYLTAPIHLPYNSSVESIQRYEGDNIIITFSHEVAGYDISKYKADDNSGYIYHLTTWDTIWHRYFPKNAIPNIALNPDKDEVESIYYYSTDGKEDILIYGKMQSDGMISLPRLVLGYYITVALSLIVLSGIFLLIYKREDKKREDKVRNIARHTFMLFLSYVLGHIFIKGIQTSSYQVQREFSAIMLLMIPIYSLFLLGTNLYRKVKTEI
ncbi:MAG: zf-HC2 domain-containing protein [Clostridiales bacterium]|nr:zf-HC2 domain-containing protein [Clostridiales bacterium]